MLEYSFLSVCWCLWKGITKLLIFLITSHSFDHISNLALYLFFSRAGISSITTKHMITSSPSFQKLLGICKATIIFILSCLKGVYNSTLQPQHRFLRLFQQSLFKALFTSSPCLFYFDELLGFLLAAIKVKDLPVSHYLQLQQFSETYLPVTSTLC